MLENVAVIRSTGVNVEQIWRLKIRQFLIYTKYSSKNLLSWSLLLRTIPANLDLSPIIQELSSKTLIRQ